MSRRRLAIPFVTAALATPAAAQDVEEFVRDNLLAVFYHELGHALIDLRSLPIFGQEEDAADVASVMLMHILYEEEDANRMVMSTADALWTEVEDAAGEVPFWDTHGASEQRYYNALCVFYGGNPEARGDMIDVMGLPPERAESCEEEFAQADFSWGQALMEIANDGPQSESFVLEVLSDDAPLTVDVLAEEIDALNADFDLGTTVPVFVESCGMPNAFYDPMAGAITVCTEFEEDLYLRFREW